jgi:hypothetical protein
VPFDEDSYFTNYQLYEVEMNELVTPKKSELTSQEMHSVMSEIADGMRKVVNTTIETAIIIAKHQDKGYWDQIEDALLHKVQWFDSSVLSMYKKIGNNLALRMEVNREKLPPSYNTLYHLAFSDPERLNTALEKGQITPKTTLAQAKKFSEKDKKRTPKKEKNETHLKIAVSIKFTEKAGKIRVAKNLLSKLKIDLEKEGGTVQWSEF